MALLPNSTRRASARSPASSHGLILPTKQEFDSNKAKAETSVREAFDQDGFGFNFVDSEGNDGPSFNEGIKQLDQGVYVRARKGPLAHVLLEIGKPEFEGQGASLKNFVVPIRAWDVNSPKGAKVRARLAFAPDQAPAGKTIQDWSEASIQDRAEATWAAYLGQLQDFSSDVVSVLLIPKEKVRASSRGPGTRLAIALSDLLIPSAHAIDNNVVFFCKTRHAVSNVLSSLGMAALFAVISTFYIGGFGGLAVDAFLKLDQTSKGRAAREGVIPRILLSVFVVTLVACSIYFVAETFLVRNPLDRCERDPYR